MVNVHTCEHRADDGCALVAGVAEWIKFCKSDHEDFNTVLSGGSTRKNSADK